MAISASEVSRAIVAQFGGCQDCNDSKNSPLHTTAFEGNVKVLKDILSRRLPMEIINQRDHMGCTPLRLAATGGNTSCVAELLDNGADLDLADVKGQTPLLIAVKNGHCACARLLLIRGANPEGDANNRSTPVCLAAFSGDSDMLQLLLDHNAQVTIQRSTSAFNPGQPFSMDPLQLAIAYQHFECSRLLLAHGAVPLYVPYHVIMSHLREWKLTATGRTLAEMFFGELRKFVMLLYEFGISLWGKDVAGRYAWDATPRRRGMNEEGEDEEKKKDWEDVLEFWEELRSQPRSLKSSCRLAVFRWIRTRNQAASVLKVIPCLPQHLSNYLSFEQL